MKPLRTTQVPTHLIWGLAFIDTVTTNKRFQIFQIFIHSQEDTAENTGTSADCGRSSIPDNKSNGIDSVQDKSGDTPQEKLAELEQDYKKVVQKGSPIDQRLAMCFRILHREFLNKKNGTTW